MYSKVVRQRQVDTLQGIVRGTLLALVGAVVPCGELPAQEMLTGRALEQHLESPTGFQWRELELGEALENLGEAQNIAIWLDRRVDPNQELDFEARDEPLADALLRLARKAELGMSQVGDVIYLGPEETTQRLATVAALRRQEATQLPVDTQRRMAQLPAISWDEVSEPRVLFKHVANQAGLRALYLERIPHDLWRPRQLPRMHAAEVLSLILAGFDLTFEYAPDGSAIRPTPMPAEAKLERRYPYTGNVAQASEKIREFFPQVELEPVSGGLEVAGTAEEHREIARFLRGDTMRRTIVSPGDKVYTLRVERQPLGPVLQALGNQLGRRVAIDPAVTEAQLEQLVSFEVRDATLSQLLLELLEPAGLAYELRSEEIKVKVKSP